MAEGYTTNYAWPQMDRKAAGFKQRVGKILPALSVRLWRAVVQSYGAGEHLPSDDICW